MNALRTVRRKHAQRLAITKQHLDARDAAMMDVICDLGCVQLDPISAVERTQYLVLWSRLGQYDRAAFDALIYDERRLFEYWAHAASIVLTDDFPLHQWEMHNWRTPKGESAWSKRQREMIHEYGDLRDHILKRLSEEGSLPSRAFKDDRVGDATFSGWTSPRLVSRMFDHLWSAGYILVDRREGTQRHWGLAERVLPESTSRHAMSTHEVTYAAAQRAIQALGVATAAQIKLHFTRHRYPDLAQVLKQLVKDERVHPVQVVAADDKPLWKQTAYIHADDIALLDRIEAGEWYPHTVLLSPFDNLICDRKRTEQLWDFHYRIEIYVPKAKREYGYYVLPILHGDTLVGRIDPLMDRDSSTLYINNVYKEDHAPVDPDAVLDVRAAIEGLGTFLGAEDIVFRGQVPSEWAGLKL